MTQGVGPEFNPSITQKKKKKSQNSLGSKPSLVRVSRNIKFQNQVHNKDDR
jgi:hypothetical protein